MLAPAAPLQHVHPFLPPPPTHTHAPIRHLSHKLTDHLEVRKVADPLAVEGHQSTQPLLVPLVHLYTMWLLWVNWKGLSVSW